jgi:fumarate reductase subunit D
MHLRRMLPVLLLAAGLSIAIAVFAATRHSEFTFALAAILFALQVLLIMLRLNVPLWQAGVRGGDVDWAWHNSGLTAITFGWGAAVMLTAYPLGGLVWRHWWQYGLGMALLGAATLLTARHLIGSNAPHRSGRALQQLMLMTMGLMAAIVLALIYLVASGKLATPKDDWAANVVFIAGGVTVLLISISSLVTYRRTTAA